MVILSRKHDIFYMQNRLFHHKVLTILQMGCLQATVEVTWASWLPTGNCRCICCFYWNLCSHMQINTQIDRHTDMIPWCACKSVWFACCEIVMQSLNQLIQPPAKVGTAMNTWYENKSMGSVQWCLTFECMLSSWGFIRIHQKVERFEWMRVLERGSKKSDSIFFNVLWGFQSLSPPAKSQQTGRPNILP